MNFKEIKTNKKQYLDLLLLADEQEEMIDKYLDQGKMYVLTDKEKVVGECVITDEGNTLEIKNIATKPEFQGNGYGKAMIEYIIKRNANKYSYIQVGTGDSPLTVPFYKKCGFEYSHRIKDFFIKNYDHPIFEAGVQLKDMVYYKKELR